MACAPFLIIVDSQTFFSHTLEPLLVQESASLRPAWPDFEGEFFEPGICFGEPQPPGRKVLAQHGTAERVGMEMLHQAEIGVDATLEGCTLGMPGFMRLRYAVIFQKSAVHIAFCAVGNVNPARLENNSKILDTLGVMLK